MREKKPLAKFLSPWSSSKASLKKKWPSFEMRPEFKDRSLNEGFSGGEEKKRDPADGGS
jgi:Fe-S cluster assembly ATPase SufC